MPCFIFDSESRTGERPSDGVDCTNADADDLRDLTLADTSDGELSDENLLQKNLSFIARVSCDSFFAILERWHEILLSEKWHEPVIDSYVRPVACCLALYCKMHYSILYDCQEIQDDPIRQTQGASAFDAAARG